MENSDNLCIDLDELVRAVQHVVEHIKRYDKGPVEISEDYYWEIDERELYDPSSDPANLSLGQLSEDWERVQRILQDDSATVGYALVWLSSLLRAVGQRRVP